MVEMGTEEIMEATVVAEIAEDKQNDLIVVEQLPVIRQKLEGIKADVQSKVNAVLALNCTESTVKAIKVLRADLNKDYKVIEAQRKAVKEAIMAPYERFNDIYKECVSSIYSGADDELKRRISEVENKLKDEKAGTVKAYFEELCQKYHIDFVQFEQAGIKIGLQSSLKSLKAAVDVFVNRIVDDLKLIEIQEYKEEIVVEYRKSLNASEAITGVIERHKAIEAERIKAENVERVKEAEAETVHKVEEAAALSAPVEVVDDPIVRFAAMIDLPKSHVKAFKKWIEDNGGSFKQIKLADVR
jgi:hypothetical protein